MWNVFAGIRRIVIFALGVMLFLDGMNDKSNTLAELIIGSIMVGVLPLETVNDWKPFILNRTRNKHLIDRSGTRVIERDREAPE